MFSSLSMYFSSINCVVFGKNCTKPAYRILYSDGFMLSTFPRTFMGCLVFFSLEGFTFVLLVDGKFSPKEAGRSHQHSKSGHLRKCLNVAHYSRM